MSSKRETLRELNCLLVTQIPLGFNTEGADSISLNGTGSGVRVILF